MRADLAAHERLQVALRERVREVPARSADERKRLHPPTLRLGPRAPRRKRALEINGKRYDSFRAARDAHGVGTGTLYRWIDLKKAKYVE